MAGPAFRFIAWDFDGTLVDSRPLIEAGMGHTLRTLGLPASLMETWLGCVGLPLEAGIAHTFGPLGLDHATVLKAYRSFAHAEEERLLRPFDGIPDLLDTLRDRGVRMGIATSKRRTPLLRQVARFGWETAFDPIVTPDEVTHGKPHPESLELMGALTGLAAAEMLMVGDTPYDLDMARAAGVPSLAVGHGFADAGALAASEPLAFAPDTAALRDILLAWTA